MMTTTTSREMEIKGTTGLKEKGRLPLIKVEMGNLSRIQGIQGMIIMQLLLNRNIFLFILFVVSLHRIHLIAGESIVGPLDTLLGFVKSIQTWLRGRQI